MKIKCSGVRGVMECENIRDAVDHFGGIIARRLHGKRGYVRAKRQDSWSTDGKSSTWEIYTGVSDSCGNTVGKNEWLHLYSV